MTKEPTTNLGTFSISLAVKNIKASYEFYQNFGFKKLDGAIEQNWLVLENGKAKIGLFQGMFPKNTITFNPEDARSIYKNLQQVGIEAGFSNGMENDNGPASFSITDPDGNPILVDQH